MKLHGGNTLKVVRQVRKNESKSNVRGCMCWPSNVLWGSPWTSGREKKISKRKFNGNEYEGSILGSSVPRFSLFRIPSSPTNLHLSEFCHYLPELHLYYTSLFCSLPTFNLPLPDTLTNYVKIFVFFFKFHPATNRNWLTYLLSLANLHPTSLAHKPNATSLATPSTHMLKNQVDVTYLCRRPTFTGSYILCPKLTLSASLPL